MLKNMKWSFSAALLLSMLSFAGAADPGLLAAGREPDLKAVSVDTLKEAPAVKDLLAAVPTDLLEKTGIEITIPAPEVKAEARDIKTVAPGTDITPKIEDAARVTAILKLISDIYDGNHLPYSQDGATFTNKEGKLPNQSLGYYKEYTLLTGNAPHTVVVGGQTYQVAPDLSARGSERIIIGGGEFVYYTPDHYKNFIPLTVVR